MLFQKKIVLELFSADFLTGGLVEVLSILTYIKKKGENERSGRKCLSGKENDRTFAPCSRENTPQKIEIRFSLG